MKGKLIIRQCPYCSELFTTNITNKYYCNYECYNKYKKTKPKMQIHIRKDSKSLWDIILRYMQEHDCQYEEARQIVDNRNKD